VNLDQSLVVFAVTAYIVGTAALLTYMLARLEAAKNVGIVCAVAGCAVQFGELVYRWLSSGIWPLTNLYGSLSLFAAMSVAIYLGFAFKYQLWFMGGFVLALAGGFLAYGLTWNEGYMPAVPALQSYWIKIHVPLVVSSYASFLVSFVASALYLVKFYGERNLDANLARSVALSAAGAGGPATGIEMKVATAPRSIIVGDVPNLERAAAQGSSLALWLASLPSLVKLDILAYRIVALGLPLLTLGIITGAWWAKEAWGAYWQWDPKETAALVSWIFYAMYMHLHTRNAWRGTRCAWLNVFGFVSIIFCYLGVNIWISGLHSYKM